MSKIDLKSFRKANRLTQSALAKYLGIQQGFISQIENGESTLPMKLLDKILSNPDWDTTSLTGGESEDSQLIASLRETIKAQRETIDYQKEIISMLKEKGSQSIPARKDAPSVFEQSQNL